jgi:hypothetical protein
MFGSYPRGLGPLGEQTLEIGSVAVLSPAPQYFHLRHFSGQLRSGYSPVLTITSDQASMMFAAANFLAYSCGLRLVWFPDINHIESNAEKAVFVATGIPQINEKVSFLARLPYGPRKNAGHWHSQMQQAFEAPAFFRNNQQSLRARVPSYIIVSSDRLAIIHAHHLLTAFWKSYLSETIIFILYSGLCLDSSPQAFSELQGAILILFCSRGSPIRVALRKC